MTRLSPKRRRGGKLAPAALLTSRNQTSKGFWCSWLTDLLHASTLGPQNLCQFSWRFTCVIVLSTLLLGLDLGHAAALELQNRSAVVQILFVEEKEQNRSISLDPGETLKKLCLKGCKLKAESGQILDVKGDEKLQINSKGIVTLAE